MMTSLETIIERNVIATVAQANVPVVIPPEVMLWADRINEATEQERDAMLHKGRMLIDAKKALGHGKWERLFKKHKGDADAPVPFSVTWAKMYMAVTAHPVLGNRNLGYVLPTSLSASYELTHIPDWALNQFIAEGLITPELQKADAVALRAVVTSPLPYRMRLQISPKRVVRHARHYAETIESLEHAQAELVRYGTLVNEELSAPLMIGDDGKIQSGVVWIPPFAQPSPMKAKPIKALHRCKCGHVHEDQGLG